MGGSRGAEKTDRKLTEECGRRLVVVRSLVRGCGGAVNYFSFF
jgi:hypothetical protein